MAYRDALGGPSGRLETKRLNQNSITEIGSKWKIQQGTFRQQIVFINYLKIATGVRSSYQPPETLEFDPPESGVRMFVK